MKANTKAGKTSLLQAVDQAVLVVKKFEILGSDFERLALRLLGIYFLLRHL